MAKIPPAMWEDPAAFVPDEAVEREAEEATEATEPSEPDDGAFKRIAKEDDEAVEDSR